MKLMMKRNGLSLLGPWLVTSMCLFAGLYVFAEQTNVLKGSDVQLMITSRTNEEVDSCKITIPDGSSYSVFPISTLPYSIKNMTKAFPESCTIKLLSVSVKMKGIYMLTIETIRGDETNSTFLRVQESVDVWPTSLDKVYQGEDFFMKLDVEVPGLTECHVIYPIGSTNVDVILSKEDNPLPEGQCGLRASNVNVSNSGFWTLYTINSTQNSYIGQKKIKVYDNNGEFVQQPLELGSESSIAIYSSNLQTDITYCLPKSTDGIPAKLQNGVCSLPRSIITDNDARNYSFTLGLKGKLEEVDSTLKVSVYPGEVSSEYKPIETSVNITSSGSLNLLCRLWSTNKITDDNKVSFCRFVRPDSKGLQVSEGLGNKLYSYFGNGLNTPHYKDCGLTIYLPTKVDHGTWKCYLYWKNKLRMGELEVGVKTKIKRSVREVVVSGSKKMVLALGTVNQVLYCQASKKLDYCWFLMPNGTHAVPALDHHDLASGLCSYTLSKVTFSHSGDWVCNMGITGRQEGDLAYHIPVQVTDSTLIAEMREVKAVTGGTADLRCTSVPAGKTLTYCRFVSPTGKGFGFSDTNRNEKIMDRYQQTGSLLEQYSGIKVGICSMTIMSVQPEDYGKWRCNGVIQGTFREGFDFVSVIQQEVNGVSTAAISGTAVAGAVAVALVVAAVWWVVRKRSHSRHHHQSCNVSEHSSEEGFQMGELASPRGHSAPIAYLRAGSRRRSVPS